MVTIAVDAMGGDNAPTGVVEGALRALEADLDLKLVLVGEHALLDRIVEAARVSASVYTRIGLVHTNQAVRGDDEPIKALRAQPEASIAVAIRLLRDGAVDGVFSAGNTGAGVATATLQLPKLPDVRRPGIAVVVPTQRARTLLMDVGANLSPRASDLAEYARLATAYVQVMMGRERPVVGLLNVGVEQTKGHRWLQAAAALIAADDKLVSIGNVEGHDLLSGRADVVVCDAFTGNVTLKLLEGIAPLILDHAVTVLGSDLGGEGGRGAEGTPGNALYRCYDYAEYGGAPLLGLNGVVVLGHGRSKARAIASGLAVASEAVRRNLVARLTSALVQD